MPSRRKLCQSLIDPTANIRRELRPLTGTCGRESNRLHTGLSHIAILPSRSAELRVHIRLNTALVLSAPGRSMDPRPAATRFWRPRGRLRRFGILERTDPPQRRLSGALATVPGAV